MYAVVNPATGRQVRTYPPATDAQIDAALTTAADGAAAWRATPVPERVAVLRRAAAPHRERAPELGAAITQEMGKPLAAAIGEVEFAADILDYYAEHAPAITADQPLAIAGEGSAVIRRSPLGVLLGIMPWNFPAYQVARFAGPNLALGNGVVVKHAPQCPRSAELGLLAAQEFVNNKLVRVA